MIEDINTAYCMARFEEEIKRTYDFYKRAMNANCDNDVIEYYYCKYCDGITYFQTIFDCDY